MTLKAKLLAAIALLVLLAIASSTAFALYYRGNAIDYKAQRDTAAGNLKLANDTITDMQTRQHDVAALDAKYTKDLASAKDTISDLRRDVDSGKRRLQLNATCESKPATSGSLGDVATARLNDTAQRDYFTLRERIATITGQVNYLQQYINEQCLK